MQRDQDPGHDLGSHGGQGDQAGDGGVVGPRPQRSQARPPARRRRIGGGGGEGVHRDSLAD